MSLTPLKEEKQLRKVPAMDELDRAIGKLNDRLNKIQYEASISAGPCDECKWFHCLNPIVTIDSDYVCANPLVSLPSFNPITHEPSFSWVRLDAARARGPCGPNGRLWEPRELYRRSDLWLKGAIVGLVLFFASMIYSCSSQLS